KARGESEYSTPDFLKKVREVAKSLNIPQDMLKRGVNVGFSGGEKKRNEILQMALFEPSLCILDEMDSGLDIDALRIAADGGRARAAAGCRQGRRYQAAGARRLRAHRSAAPAHRRLEVHRPARADPRSAAAGGRAGRRRAEARRGCAEGGRDQRRAPAGAGG